MNNFSELVREERPDYKVYNSGFDSLNSVELISLIIGQGKSTRAAMQQARQIVNICGGSLRDIATRRAEELQVVQGVDPKKAMTLQAAFELAKRIEVGVVATILLNSTKWLLFFPPTALPPAAKTPAAFLRRVPKR